MPGITYFTETDLDAAQIEGELNTSLPRPFGILHLGAGHTMHVRTAGDARRMIEALTEIAIGLDFHARAVESRVPATAAPVEPPAEAPLDVTGQPFPGRPGYLTGTCGHAVAGSEWRAGFRSCEHCPTVTADDVEADSEPQS